MIDSKKCRFCKYLNIKSGVFFASYYCSKNKCKVKYDSLCSHFICDDNKILKYADFGPRNPKEKVSCDLCLYRKGDARAVPVQHRCEMLDVIFDNYYSPHLYKCAYFKNGGQDALLNVLCESIIAQNNVTKLSEENKDNSDS